MKLSDIVKLIETEYHYKTTKNDLTKVLVYTCVLDIIVEQLKYLKMTAKERNKYQDKLIKGEV